MMRIIRALSFRIVGYLITSRDEQTAVWQFYLLLAVSFLSAVSTVCCMLRRKQQNSLQQDKASA
jgi:hypothetical protein